MTDVARASGIRQIPVPAGNGLFVGDFHSEGDSTMETYLVFDDGQISRWAPVRTALLGAIKANGLSPEGAYMAACYGPRPGWGAVATGVAQALAPFWWLKEDSTPGSTRYPLPGRTTTLRRRDRMALGPGDGRRVRAPGKGALDSVVGDHGWTAARPRTCQYRL